MDETVQERAQLIAERAHLYVEPAASLCVGLRVAFALNNVVATYQEHGGYGLGDVTADDAEELLARLQSVEWNTLTRDEVERLVRVLHAFMLDVHICPPAFLDFCMPAWMGARQFLKVLVQPMPPCAQDR